MRNLRAFVCSILTLGLFASVRATAAQGPLQPQQQTDADPAATLADILGAACRADEVKFAGFLTPDNAAAYRALPAEERRRLLQRFSLSDDPGHPLLSSDQNNRTILRCEAPGGVTEFHFGVTRMHENLAFIPLSATNNQQADIGLVREASGWKLLSLGLVLLDIKQLAVQWAQADLAAHEDAAATAVQTIAAAVEHYKSSFGKLPDTLAQLGPAPQDQASPDLASLVSAPLAAGNDGGYRFRYRVISGADSLSDQYEIEAMPDDYGTSGRQSLFRDTSGQIHAADKHGASATGGDPLWQDEKTQ
jgi:hypothetical protein